MGVMVHIYKPYPFFYDYTYSFYHLSFLVIVIFLFFIGRQGDKVKYQFETISKQ